MVARRGSLAAGFWCGEEWWRRDAEPPMPVAPRPPPACHPFPSSSSHVTHHPLRLPLWRATRPLSKHASTRNTLSVHQSVKRVEGGSLLAVSVSVSDSEQDQPWGGSEGRENAGRIQRHRLRRPQVPGKQQHRCLLEPSRTASLNPIPPRRCCRRGASRTCARTPAPPPFSPGPSASRRRTRCVSCAALGTRRFSRIAIRVSFCQGKWREI